MSAAQKCCASKARLWTLASLLFVIATLLVCAGCTGAKGNQLAEAPPPATVVPDVNVNLFSVDHPEQFPLAEAVAHSTTSQLVVTGTVNPDIARTVPVISLATGRVVAIHARLGDTVKKGQTLLSIRSDDIGSGFSDYRKAVADEILARTQLERATDLFNHGALSQNDLQIAQDTEDKAKVDVETTEEHLRLLGNDPSKPKGILDIDAPISGVITDQQVTNAGGVQGLGSSPFTITDLSYVWVVCDVYENDLPNVRVLFRLVHQPIRKAVTEVVQTPAMPVWDGYACCFCRRAQMVGAKYRRADRTDPSLRCPLDSSVDTPAERVHQQGGEAARGRLHSAHEIQSHLPEDSDGQPVASAARLFRVPSSPPFLASTCKELAVSFMVRLGQCLCLFSAREAQVVGC
jgi:hypothetical protein